MVFFKPTFTFFLIPKGWLRRPFLVHVEKERDLAGQEGGVGGHTLKIKRHFVLTIMRAKKYTLVHAPCMPLNFVEPHSKY